MSRTALIFGASGQDGAYLSRLLLEKDYAVHGVTRDAAQAFPRLHALGIRERVTTHAIAVHDRDAVRSLIEAIRPDEIYNLCGLSSVAQSFVAPETAAESIVGMQQMLLDIVRDFPIRLYQSASSDCFGEIARGSAFDEDTPFAPRSPYAVAKAEAHRLTGEYRRRYGLFAVSGLVSNHESPLRGEQFVTKKIIAAAAAAARGALEGPLHLGNLSASRDWGYAPEYAEAMWLMLQQPEPADYVIATGESHTVEELMIAAFAAFGLDHRRHVVTDSALLRPSDIQYSRGNPARAKEKLRWEARTKFAALVEILARKAASTASPYSLHHPAASSSS